VFRLSKLTSTSVSEGGFLMDAGQRLKARESIQAATDQFLNITSVDDVARVIEFAIETNLRGLWHVAAPPVRSRYDWFVQLAEHMSIPSDSIEACSLLDLDFPEPRPRDCALQGASLAKRLPWKLSTGDDLIISAAAALIA
jgi:dTDP-4-dehydrorhamnose reductase